MTMGALERVSSAELVKQVLAELPAGLVASLRHVSIVVKDAPDVHDLARGVKPDQRGMFWGSAPERREPGISARDLPDLVPATGRIAIFARNIQPPTLDHFRRVLLHEIGHALGYDEAELVGEMGLG